MLNILSAATSQPVPTQWVVDFTTLLAALGLFLGVATPIVIKFWGMIKDALHQSQAASTQAGAAQSQATNAQAQAASAQTVAEVAKATSESNGRRLDVADNKINAVALSTPTATPPASPAPPPTT